jgi:DNA-directed RNA polymerase subunit RPC12/RpoP
MVDGEIFVCSRCKLEFDMFDLEDYDPDLCQACLWQEYETLELQVACPDCGYSGVTSPREADILSRYGCSHCGGSVKVYD